MKLEKIIRMNKNEQTYDWERIENEIGFIFPTDYKYFIDSYGEGGFNEFLWILSPFSQYENLNNAKKLHDMKFSYEKMQQELPEMCEYSFYVNGEGLFPWGITDNGDELYWNISDEKSQIIVIASRYSRIEVFNTTMIEYLYGLFSKNIESDIFPEDFFTEDNYYEL